jgi:catechol 2,3-dioxygenase-like lactoylglutathione lyase family enzyme
VEFEALHQIAGTLADDVDAQRRHYERLGLPVLATFDPPGLMFVALGAVRLMLQRGAAPATVYLRVADLDATYARLRRDGFVFEDAPHLVYRDDEGRFGPPGAAESMTFLRDPAGNTLGLVERRID